MGLARKPAKAVKMTPGRESVQLFHSGTVTFVISAANIVQAAESDMVAKEWNAVINSQRRDFKGFPRGSAARKNIEKPRGYAFRAPHVRKARDAADLLRIAWNNRGDVPGGSDRNTLLLYSDGEKLLEAIGIIEKRISQIPMVERCATEAPE